MKRPEWGKRLRVTAAILMPFATASIQNIFWTTFQPLIWFLSYPMVFFVFWAGSFAARPNTVVYSAVIGDVFDSS
jgi:hypothetical protein